MKTTPMLFNANMVCALIDGNKTQTRRPMRPAFSGRKIVNLKTEGDTISQRECSGRFSDPTSWGYPYAEDGVDMAIGAWPELCPYGTAGDLIWVRETFADLRGTGIEGTDPYGRNDSAYSADVKRGSAADEARIDFGIKWKPSIHMPRWASRLTLRITDVRVERLRDISDADQLAEGTPTWFRESWESNYAASGHRWDANPWVWVVTFTVHHHNIDTLARHLQAQRDRQEFVDQFAGMCS